MKNSKLKSEIIKRMNDPKWDSFIAQKVIDLEKNDMKKAYYQQKSYRDNEIIRIDKLLQNKMILKIAAGLIITVGIGLTAFLNLSNFENSSLTKINSSNKESLSIYDIEEGDLLWEGNDKILEQDPSDYMVDSSIIIDY